MTIIRRIGMKSEMNVTWSFEMFSKSIRKVITFLSFNALMILSTRVILMTRIKAELTPIYKLTKIKLFIWR